MPVDFATLRFGAEEIARVEEIQVDEWVGWLRGRWSPLPGFARIHELFAAKEAVGGHYDASVWRSVWERLWDQGVSLEFDGNCFTRDFAVEIDRENRTWVTYWGLQLDRPPPRASVGPATREDLVAVTDPTWRQA